MAHVPLLPESLDPHSAASLALQACVDVDSLHVLRLAYACIEKLVVPQRVNDTEEIYPLRTELAALDFELSGARCRALAPRLAKAWKMQQPARGRA